MNSSADHHYRGLLGSFGSHFGQIWANLSSVRGLKASYWSHIGANFIPFLAQKSPNTPKLCTVAIVINTKYLGKPLGAILGFIWAIFGLLEQNLGLYLDSRARFCSFLGQCHPFLQPKRALLPFYQVQCNRL